MAVFSPSRAPCLVLALEREHNYSIITNCCRLEVLAEMDYSEQSSTVENRNPNEHKPLIHCAVDVHLQFVLEVLLSHFFSFTSCQTGWELVKCCFLLSLSSTQELIHAFALHCIVINKWDHKYPPSSAALVLSLRLLQWLRVSIDASSSLNGWTFPCCPPA